MGSNTNVIRDTMNPYVTPSLARTLEHIEILRSNLRFKFRLDHAGIQKLLRRVEDIREELLFLSGSETYQRELGETPDASRPKAPRNGFVFEGVFGDNPKIAETLETAEKVAGTDLPVLIEGESGTGKELLAKVVHANSDRSEKPFVSVNCGAIIPTLLESELFGHVKGAFTGSVKDRKGKFEIAGGGTIFLDEIGDIPQESQVKLLRVLENGEIQRVGSDESVRVNARVLAATNRNLYRMMLEEKFREDLYYRLSIITVTLPPLRERRDEIGLLIDWFRAEAAEKLNREKIAFTPRLYGFLLNHAYRGNIRELRNIVYRLSCLSNGRADLKHLPETIRPAGPVPETHFANSLEEVRKAASDVAEKQFLEENLRNVRGNVTELAKRIGMNRSYLQTLIKKLGIRAKDFRNMDSPDALRS